MQRTRYRAETTSTIIETFQVRVLVADNNSRSATAAAPSSRSLFSPKRIVSFFARLSEILSAVGRVVSYTASSKGSLVFRRGQNYNKKTTSTTVVQQQEYQVTRKHVSSWVLCRTGRRPTLNFASCEMNDTFYMHSS